MSGNVKPGVLNEFVDWIIDMQYEPAVCEYVERSRGWRGISARLSSVMVMFKGVVQGT